MSGGTPHADPFGLVGTLLERKYRVDRVVAHGGFGVVYQGHHAALDAAVAIKILRPPREVDPDTFADLLTQFLDEAKTLAKLRHPSVVGVLDAGVIPNAASPGGLPWMALEWLEGSTLREDLAQRRGKGGRTPAECLELLGPVLDAIAHAHDAGIAHRDLKPSNIMLVPGARGVSPRVLDFGIAKMMDPDAAGDAPSGDTGTESRVSSFTAAFAAPEQLSGARTGPWTDVFALGLLLTEMLADAPPLPVGDPTEHYRAVFAAERPTPRKLRVDVGAWEPVLARALAVRPSDRQASARVLAEELGAALAAAKHAPLDHAETAGDRPEAPLDSGYSATDRRPAAEVAREAKELRAHAGARGRWGKRAWLGAAAAVLAAALAAVAVGARSRGGTAERPRPVAAVATCTNKSCTQKLGRAAVCRPASGACAALESVDCAVRAEPADLERDDTVWIGALFPRTGPSAAEYGVWNHHAVELARRDFAQIMGGVSGDRARPLAVLECDDAVDPRRAAAHLVDDVGVPAVIGFKSGVEAIDLANALFLPRGVLTVAATNTNPMITTIPHPPGVPRLVYRTTYSTADAATAIGRLVRDVLEPQVRALPGVGKTTPIRVATLRAKAAAGADIGDALAENLTYNGKSALANGDDYRELPYDLGAPDDAEELALVAASLLKFEPHVVVYASGRGTARGILAPVEARWRAAAPRPRWIAVSELLGEELAVIGKDRAQRQRFFGVTPETETPANARFVTHYRETFDEPVSRTDAPNSTYDAFYFLAFATYAVPKDQPVTGARLAEALGKLVPPGKEIEVGMTGIFEAFTALRAGGRIDVTGSVGKLDFDLSRGEADFDKSILCAGVDAEGHVVGVPSGLVYVAASQSLEGTLRCP